MHNTEQYSELYLPASDFMLHGFANKLAGVAHRVGRPFKDIYKVQLSLYVGHGDDEGGSLKFRYDKDQHSEEITFLHLRSIPINKTWSPEAAKLFLGSSFLDINNIEIDDDIINEHESEYDEDDLMVSVFDQYDEDEYDDVLGVSEGFLEHETKLDIIRSKNFIDAKKSIFFNVIDLDNDEVGANVVHAREAEFPLTFALQQDAERLYRFGETTIDFEASEQLLNIPTAADLIIGIHALIGSGILPEKTRAYKGAPSYDEIANLLPELYK
ncbi:hypothetical protein EB118_01350 [bacterium]|nr:hypothetical protein [bacterium]NBX97891.1 hypothetical protein [bacterium]NDC93869.1 hypothetical protein [bacterium]NDD82816.1 hypothetical protein [bacterium]NDG28735.1 hypothetical protein [bacterium]